jgi:hypothetical protein
MKKWAFYNTEKNLYLSRDFDYTDCVLNILFMDTKRDAILKYWSLDFKNELAIVSVDIKMNPNFSEIVSKEEIEELDKPEAVVDKIQNDIFQQQWELEMQKDYQRKKIKETWIKQYGDYFKRNKGKIDMWGNGK